MRSGGAERIRETTRVERRQYRLTRSHGVAARLERFSPAAKGGLEMKVGLVSFAPVYLNGLLALFCVFILPGLIFVRAFDIPNFPQRMLVIILSSLAINHFLVVLIAMLHLNPLETYRCVVLVLVVAFAGLTVTELFGRKAGLGMHYNGAFVLRSGPNPSTA
jgi:hypothetical protein